MMFEPLETRSGPRPVSVGASVLVHVLVVVVLFTAVRYTGLDRKIRAHWTPLVAPPLEAVKPAPVTKRRVVTARLPRVEMPKPAVIVAPVERVVEPVIKASAPAAPVVKTNVFSSPMQARQPVLMAAVSTGSFGGSAAVSAGGGSVGRVSTGGFGGGVVSSGGLGTGGRVSTGGFGSVAVAAAPRVQVRSEAVAMTPVEILSKPVPSYTSEARSLKVEGAVVVQAMFTAAGEVRVLGILHGLGHGLDESAMQAVRSIRFRPARKDGQPVDSTGEVEVRFQLAS